MPRRLSVNSLTRRAALCGIASTVAFGVLPFGQASAQDRYDLRELLRLDWPGQISLLHLGPLNGELLPHYFRPSAQRIVASGGAALTGEALRVRYGVGGRHPMDYALTHIEFDKLARIYGKMGGVDRVATVLSGIRQLQPNAVVLAGMVGDPGPIANLGGNIDSIQAVKAALQCDVVLGDHERVPKMFEQSGVQISVIEHRVNDLSSELQQSIDNQRAAGATIVVCLTDANLTQARDLAGLVTDLDLIFANDVPLPVAEQVGDTKIIVSGSQGRFITRFDFDVVDGKVTEVEQRLIPVFTDITTADPQMSAAIRTVRAPVETILSEVIGTADAQLFHADDIQSSWDELICAALRSELNCDIAFWPARGSGRSILAGQTITREDIWSVTGNARVRQVQIEGSRIKERLEAEAESFFGKPQIATPQYGMMRVGGLAFTLDLTRQAGDRIRELADNTSSLLDDAKRYRLATLDGSDSGDPAVADLVESYISKRRRVGQGFESWIKVVL